MNIFIKIARFVALLNVVFSLNILCCAAPASEPVTFNKTQFLLSLKLSNIPSLNDLEPHNLNPQKIIIVLDKCTIEIDTLRQEKDLGSRSLSFREIIQIFEKLKEVHGKITHGEAIEINKAITIHISKFNDYLSGCFTYIEIQQLKQSTKQVLQINHIFSELCRDSEQSIIKHIETNENQLQTLIKIIIPKRIEDSALEFGDRFDWKYPINPKIKLMMNEYTKNKLNSMDIRTKFSKGLDFLHNRMSMWQKFLIGTLPGYYPSIRSHDMQTPSLSKLYKKGEIELIGKATHILVPLKTLLNTLAWSPILAWCFAKGLSKTTTWYTRSILPVSVTTAFGLTALGCSIINRGEAKEKFEQKCSSLSQKKMDY